LYQGPPPALLGDVVAIGQLALDAGDLGQDLAPDPRDLRFGQGEIFDQRRVDELDQRGGMAVRTVDRARLRQ
jgi:hypothetical protein